VRPVGSVAVEPRAGSYADPLAIGNEVERRVDAHRPRHVGSLLEETVLTVENATSILGRDASEIVQRRDETA
jgi:hypothetical protein